MSMLKQKIQIHKLLNSVNECHVNDAVDIFSQNLNCSWTTLLMNNINLDNEKITINNLQEIISSLEILKQKNQLKQPKYVFI